MAAVGHTSLSKFKSALTYGGARPSLFDFTVTAAPGEVSDSLSDVRLYCNVSALPGMTLTPIERQYFGRTVKIPGDIVFGDLTTTIYQTEKGDERFNIESWMDQINSHVSNKSELDSTSTANFMGKYSSTGTLKQYNKAGDTAPLSTVDFVDMWPQTVAEIALSYDTASDLEQFDVTWAYNHYSVKIGSTLYS